MKKSFITKSNFSNKDHPVIHNILIIMIAGILIIGVSGFFMLSTIVGKVNIADPSKKILNKEPSSLYAADGSKFAELGGISRENITYKQLPQSTIDAFLSIEDSRYFSHNGFDLPRFISSALTNLRSGNFAQGGSTLTMQLIDNSIMKPEEEIMWKKGENYNKIQQVDRKIQEIYLSMKLENKLTKEEIITKYLNEINFGSSARGIQRGAQYYFDKNVEDLNLSESAFLAGVIQAPNDYNPYSGGEFFFRAKTRRNETLRLMNYHGFISDVEYSLAKNSDLSFQLGSGKNLSSSEQYKAYADAVQKEVKALTGVDPALVPMKIYTSLDLQAQNRANALSAGQNINLPNNDYYQMGFTMLNNQNGEIVAVSAGRSDVDATYIARFNEPKQPGSTIKPILDYAPTFENLGWCTSRMITDKPVQIDGRTIKNADEKYYGNVSLERAIAQSLNTPAIQALQAYYTEAGEADLIKYMSSLGIDEDVARRFNMQYAIGADKLELSPTQLAAAYAPLANGGYYYEPHMVRKVVYSDGSKTVENKIVKKHVMSAETAFMTSDLLYEAVNGDYKRYNLMGSLGFGKYPVYGKTGTTDWGGEGEKYGGEMKDEWMLNYTSEYTIASWTGFDIGVVGGNTSINDYLNMNVNGHINKQMLDEITTNHVKKIDKPTDVSEYGGGYIRSKFLKDAAKINPSTAEKEEDESENLQALINAAAKYSASEYTSESYQNLVAALKNARDLLNDAGASKQQLAAASAQLQAAIQNLVKKEVEVTVDKSALNAAINQSVAYVDSTKYQAAQIAALQEAVNAALLVNNNSAATQSEVDEKVAAINAAIQECIKHPLP